MKARKDKGWEGRRNAKQGKEGGGNATMKKKKMREQEDNIQ